jgi:catechol 2,3-dioxygenase-like lactoylglutathione lyase family enzyme
MVELGPPTTQNYTEGAPVPPESVDRGNDMQAGSIAWRLGAALLVLIAPFLGLGQASAAKAHFHHVHLNTQDPQHAIAFYTSKFEARRARFAGLQDAVWTGDSWILFTKVNAPPPASLISPIWHFGWGAPDMKAEYERQLASGTKFFAPLTPLSTSFFFAYVESPEHALIELNTAATNHFGHVHLFSADPVGAGDWYMKHFGLTRRGTGVASREPRFRGDLQIGPSVSLMADHVNLIIYPVEYSKKQYAGDWQQGQTALVSSRGRIVDHIGFSVADLDATLDELRDAGVTITSAPRVLADGKIRFAFIEGPDRIAIELIEDHTGTPQ